MSDILRPVCASWPGVIPVGLCFLSVLGHPLGATASRRSKWKLQRVKKLTACTPGAKASGPIFWSPERQRGQKLDSCLASQSRALRMTHTSQSVLGRGWRGRRTGHSTFLHHLEKIFTTERRYDSEADITGWYWLDVRALCKPLGNQMCIKNHVKLAGLQILLYS